VRNADRVKKAEFEVLKKIQVNYLLCCRVGLLNVCSPGLGEGRQEGGSPG
jgi:hypothetical protein